MPIKVLWKWVITASALAYPLLMHWVLPLWPDLPQAALTMPPTILNGWLAWIFGRTLQAGREPLISSFARIERTHLLKLPASAPIPLDTAAYTRSLTRIWTALFIALAIVSALLACSGWLAWWALFTSVISYLMVGTLFLGEYLYRRARFAHYPHANPIQFAWFLIKSGPVWLRGAS